MNEIEIFGVTTSPRKHRRGCYLTVNVKNRNAYLSQDACKLIFGPDCGKSARLLIIHSKIEKTWYFAQAVGDLFTRFGGFECVVNDPKNETSLFRINGAAETLKAMTKEMAPGEERAVFTFDKKAVDYDNMKLYKVILNK